MKFRTLGKTGLKVSVIGVGTWQYGGEWAKTFTQDEVDAILGKAHSLGINLIDTAECYGDHLSERMIGQAIRNLGHKREDWIIATKFGHKFHKPFERDDRFDAQGVRKQLEDSLAALQTDYIDLYQFHSGTNEQFENPELWSLLAQETAAGKVRHLGVSISSKGDAYQAQQSSAVGVGALQVLFNRIQQKPAEDGTLDEALKQNLGVLARVPLASGFLSGKYDVDHVFDAADVRQVWFGDEKRNQLEQVKEIKAEVPEGTPMAQWALAWCLKQPAVTCVIPGCKTVEQVEKNAAAADLEID